jgi:hypothetical protein
LNQYTYIEEEGAQDGEKKDNESDKPPMFVVECYDPNTASF